MRVETFHLHSQYVPLQDCSLSLDKNSGSSSGYPSSPHSGLVAGRIRRQRWKIFWKCLLDSGEMLSLFKMKMVRKKKQKSITEGQRRWSKLQIMGATMCPSTFEDSLPSAPLLYYIEQLLKCLNSIGFQSSPGFSRINFELQRDFYFCSKMINFELQRDFSFCSK